MDFIELDSQPAVSGIARAQQAGAFTNSSFSGNYAFGTGGQSFNGPITSAGRMTADGAGSISAGVKDENDTITVTQNLSFTGTYTVSANGRGVGTLTSSASNSSVVFYMISRTEAVLISSDPLLLYIGHMDTQTAAPYSDASIRGQYGVVDSMLNGGLEQDAVMQFTTDGAGSGSGMEDLNAGLIPTAPIPFTAAYSVTSNGRVLATLSSTRGQSTFALYLSSSSKAFVVGLHPGIAERGLMERQF
jgi:hypothetical protein